MQIHATRIDIFLVHKILQRRAIITSRWLIKSYNSVTFVGLTKQYCLAGPVPNVKFSESCCLKKEETQAVSDWSKAVPRAIKWLMAEHPHAVRDALDDGFFGESGTRTRGHPEIRSTSCWPWAAWSTRAGVPGMPEHGYLMKTVGERVPESSRCYSNARAELGLELELSGSRAVAPAWNEDPMGSWRPNQSS